MPGSDDIRPYSDDEINAVIQRLLRQRDFLELVGRFRARRIYNLAPPLIRFWVALQMRLAFGRIQSVAELQSRMAPLVTRGLKSTTTGISWSGLEHLDSTKPCLFLSSHRDIVLDPALVNYALYESGMDTTRIAIGDNLTDNPMVADLMRLNKSFIVRRNLSNPREMRNTFLELSRYIRDSLSDGHSIWMAQREGRAKDGVDVSDPAIIKMLYMSHKRDGVSLAESIRALRVVPVAISYEFDPCDEDKARELEERYRTGHYQKRPGEDIESIVKGVSGFKGHVHVAFGTPLDTEDVERPDDVAQAVDEQILSLMRFHPVNYAAAEKLASRHAVNALPASLLQEMPDRARLSEAHSELDHRLQAMDPALHPWLLGIYANALLRRHNVAVGELRNPDEEPES